MKTVNLLNVLQMLIVNNATLLCTLLIVGTLCVSGLGNVAPF